MSGLAWRLRTCIHSLACIRLIHAINDYIALYDTPGLRALGSRRLGLLRAVTWRIFLVSKKTVSIILPWRVLAGGFTVFYGISVGFLMDDITGITASFLKSVTQSRGGLRSNLRVARDFFWSKKKFLGLLFRWGSAPDPVSGGFASLHPLFS